MYACGIPTTCSKTTSSPSRQRSVRFRPATHASIRARLPRTGSGLNLEWLISNVKALCPGGAGAGGGPNGPGGALEGRDQVGEGDAREQRPVADRLQVGVVGARFPDAERRPA